LRIRKKLLPAIDRGGPSLLLVRWDFGVLCNAFCSRFFDLLRLADDVVGTVYPVCVWRICVWPFVVCRAYVQQNYDAERLGIIEFHYYSDLRHAAAAFHTAFLNQVPVRATRYLRRDQYVKNFTQVNPSVFDGILVRLDPPGLFHRPSVWFLF
jgi:hypothetical protein